MSENSPLQTPRMFSAAYWRLAARQLTNPKMLALAAVVVALRAICKMLEIPLGPHLNVNVASVFNAVGAMVYGPVVGIAGAVVSDPLGYLLHPDGPYFLPYMLCDISSSFIFGLFFWHRTPSVARTLWAKFTVNMVSNILLTSLITKFYEQEENTTMSNKRTIAFTVPEDIFLDFKEYLDRNNLKQGLFLLNYIKRVLAEDAEAKSE